MNKYKPTFGIEVHAELLTKTKAFSPAEVNLIAPPNTKVHPIDIGYPGTKPTVNKKMIEYAYRLAKALDMNIANTIRFDRKNYFYPDLANGYQITQFFEPIATEGKLTITKEDGTKKDIHIKQIQIEEDTARQINKDGQMLLDFNRAGVPLVEIVSKYEDFKSIDEIITYVKQLREQLIVLGINDGNLHKGSFRVDVNVSISKDESYGERVEIKNINSFTNIKTALEYEIKLQEKTLENGGKIEYVTKKFNEETQQTVLMRSKDSQTEYNFIPEGNINPIRFTQDLKDEFDKFEILKIERVRNNILKGIPEKQKQTILSNLFLLKAFIHMVKEVDLNKVANFLTTNVVFALKQAKEEVKFNNNLEVKLTLILKLLLEGKTTSNEVNKLLISLINEKSITAEITKLNNKELKSNDDVKDIVAKIMNIKPELKNEYQERPERVEKFLMGQLMKETKGKINPQKAMKIVRKVLDEQI